MTTRPAAVAGRFYPADPTELAAQVDDLLAAARPTRRPPRPVAVVAPHAGYRYSGAVAATAHAVLAAARDELRRAVLLGPAHFVPLRGTAVPGVDAFATPLGPVPVDDDLRTAAVATGSTAVDDRPHAAEHSVETQLPFLQRALGPGVRVLPVLVGDTEPAAVGALLASLLAAPGTVAVVSTDLSHYLGRRAAQRRDERTAAAVLARDGDAIGPTDACGSHPLRGLLHHAVDRDLTVELLRLATSADADGDPRRVVGYGAFALFARGTGPGPDAGW